MGDPGGGRRLAFSLVELLAVLLVIGVLVGFAIPRFHRYKLKAHTAAMVSDLRDLAASEEDYWNMVRGYTSDTTVLDITNSPGVTVTLVSADSMGWSARATYISDPAVCAIYYGAAPPLPPATVKNVIGCVTTGGRVQGSGGEGTDGGQ